MKFEYGLEPNTTVKVPAGTYYNVDTLTWFNLTAPTNGLVEAVNGPVTTVKLETNHTIKTATITLLSETTPRIVSAAIIDHTGKIWTLDPPARHYDIAEHMAENGYIKEIRPINEGFMLNNGEFCKRKNAFKIAKDAGQLLTKKKSNLLGNGIEPLLTTDDLW